MNQHYGFDVLDRVLETDLAGVIIVAAENNQSGLDPYATETERTNESAARISARQF